jgi:pyoverdine/dityrosine biosynthesis protein Dit1
MALDAVHEHGLGVEALSKFSKYEAKNEDRELFDVALEDDHMQRSYLGAKRFIMVDEITTVDALVANILTPPPSQNESAGE